MKIIVIGGGSFQGKSLIASHLAYKFKIPLVVSTDTIRNVLHILNPQVPYFFTSTYLMSPENLEKQMEEVSKVLQRLLELYEKRGESVIIEGMHLSQEFIAFLSAKSNVLIFCISNKLPLEKRLEYKSLTRNRVEYLDSKTGEVKYGQLTKNNIPFTRYVEYASRIKEIHLQIVSYFTQNNLPIIEFEDIDEVVEKTEKMMKKFI